MSKRHIERDVMNICNKNKRDVKMYDKNIFVQNKQLESKERERVKKSEKEVAQRKKTRNRKRE